MNSRLVVGLVAAGISFSVFSMSAEARCEDNNCRGITHLKKAVLVKARHHQVVRKAAPVRHQKVVRKAVPVRLAKRAKPAPQQAVAGHGTVIALIKSMAPRYGVPTWFALRIAKVESGYNPNARGSAGEFGVFQMKCATARGIGYQGRCSGLLNASTNVTYGLKHLSLAVRSSGGNLKLAASKHNGGLGRKSLVPRYVAMVF